jgi:hypothetical protein
LKYSLVWTKDAQYVLNINNEAFPPGNYYWNVAIVRDLPPFTGGNDSSWQLITEAAPQFAQIP